MVLGNNNNGPDKCKSIMLNSVLDQIGDRNLEFYG